MADINGAPLSFEALLETGQIDSAIAETLRRIKGLSDGTVSGTKEMDTAFYKTADTIRNLLGNIGTAIDTHEQELRKLESSYQELGQQAAKAFEEGRDSEFAKITQLQNSMKGEMVVRKQLISDLQEQSNSLEDAAAKMEVNNEAHETIRARIASVRNEMSAMMDVATQNGITIDQNIGKYAELREELTRLITIQNSVRKQGTILSNPKAQFQGVLSGLSGLAGAYSATNGAMSLFADKNEDLQKIMTKVQSIMAITIGLQQVSAVLNKNSAFNLVTLNGLREWWNKLLGKSAASQTAETVATQINTTAKQANSSVTATNTAAETANTAATGAQTVAATTGAAANFTLAGAFRAVGAAIKSIPVFGWIIAGITALISAISFFTSKTKEAKKAANDFAKSLAESAYQPIGAVEILSTQWNKLGDNLEEKKKFVEQNKSKFDELGVSVKDVADAENLLVRNKDAFINAQMSKAYAMVYTQIAMKKMEEQIRLNSELAEIDKRNPNIFTARGFYESNEYDKKQIKKKIADIGTEIKQGFENATNMANQGAAQLKQGLIKTTDEQNKAVEGSIKALRKKIAELNEKMEETADIKTRNELNAQIKKAEKDLKNMLGNEDKQKPKQKKEDDPFVKMLDERKKVYSDYNKWINAGMEKEAKIEFAEILKNGNNYKDFLEGVKQNWKLTAEQIRLINTAIAEETKKTVLDDFKTELSETLNNADSVIAKLAVIAKERDKLKNDGTDVDKGKEQTLDDEQKNILKQAVEDLKKAQQEYKEYLDGRLTEEARYVKKRNELQNEAKGIEQLIAAEMGKAEKERNTALIAGLEAKLKSLQTQIKMLDTKNEDREKKDYDDLLKQYQTYQQKRASIAEEYDKKIAVAVANGNEGLIYELIEAEREALNKIDIDEILKSDNYKRLFSNLDSLTVSEIIKLRNNLEKEWSKLNLPPDQLKALRDQLDKVNNEILRKNPFAELVNAVKEYINATDEADKKDVLKKIGKSAEAVAALINSAIDTVTDGLEQMGVTIDESTKKMINSLKGIVGGVSDLVNGIASGNVVSMVQGVVKIVVNAVKLITEAHDRKAEKAIKKHAEAVKELENAYNDLKRAIDKALGSAVYKNQEAALNNMRKQQAELREMVRLENDKKKTDKSKIDAWNDQIRELGYRIEDTIESIFNDVLQTTGKSFADNLGNALADAFGKGEDAATAFAKVADNVLKEAVLNQLKKNFLETQLQGALDNLYKSMGGNGELFKWDGLTDAERQAFKNEITGIANNFNEQLKMYSDVFKDAVPDADTSLTGGIKGVSEETASMLGGQINAMRINQVEATEIMRQQLFILNTIAQNTSYNHFLQNIDSKLDKITSGGDPLRSKGLS